MKTFIALAALATLVSFASSAVADTTVRGYTKKNGTYVAPHVRSSPDKTPNNNWSTKGNTNPYTGKKGTVNPNKK